MNTKKLVTAQAALAEVLKNRRDGNATRVQLLHATGAHEAAIDDFEKDLARELQADLARAGEIIAAACLKAAAARESLGGIRTLAVLDDLCVPNIDLSVRRATGPHLILGWASMSGGRSIVFRDHWKQQSELAALGDQLAVSKRLRNDANDAVNRIDRPTPRTDVA